MGSSPVRLSMHADNPIMRWAAERATHRFVIRRQLPPPFERVKIYTTSEGGLRYLRPTLKMVDPTLLRLVAEVMRPGHVVWDIGANLGLFSFATAAIAGSHGRVLAVEPDATLVILLRRSAAINPASAPVEVLPVAVADDLTVSRFHIARRNRSTSYLDGFGTTQTGGIRATELVPTVTLNWLAAHFPLPDVIKIDVEGAEIGVLTEAADVLKKSPTIICEVAGCNAGAAADILASYGYIIYDGELASSKRLPLRIAPPTTLAVRKLSLPVSRA